MERTLSTNEIKKGFFFTLLGGIFWGFSGACGQFLFSNYNLDAKDIMIIRTLFSGTLILLFNLIKNKNKALSILKNKKDLKDLILFSIFGLLFCQYSYLEAIKYSNAGTATVLEYLAPVLIIVYVCFKKVSLPKISEFISIILAISGTFLIATHGDLNNMVISEKGLFWGLSSAIGMALYTMLPVRIIKKYGSLNVLGFGLLVAGIILFIFSRGWSLKLNLDYKGYLFMSTMVLLGTVLSFTLYLKGVSYLGGVKASMVASIEPVSATVFAVIWLNSSFHYIDILGFIFIIATVFILAKSD